MRIFEISVLLIKCTNIIFVTHSRGRIDVLQDLNDLLDDNLYPKGSCLSVLYEIGNVGTHRANHSQKVGIELNENANTGQGCYKNLLCSRTRVKVGRRI